MNIPNRKGLPRWLSGKESTCRSKRHKRCRYKRQEMQIRTLGRKDTLEKEMATLSSILAWESHGQKSLEVYSSLDCKRVGHDLVTKHHHHHNNIFVYVLTLLVDRNENDQQMKKFLLQC